MAVTFTFNNKIFVRRKGTNVYAPLKKYPQVWHVYLSGRWDAGVGEDWSESRPEFKMVFEKEGVIWSADLANRLVMNQAETSEGRIISHAYLDEYSFIRNSPRGYSEIVGAAGGMCYHDYVGRTTREGLLIPITEGSELQLSCAGYSAELANAYWGGVDFTAEIFMAE